MASEPGKNNKQSKSHVKIRDLLKALYPKYTIVEEHSITGNVDGSDIVLFVDLYIKELKVAIECHGLQHYKFVKHFHQTPDRFHRQQRRDASKAAALAESGIALVVIRHDQWKKMEGIPLMRMIVAAQQRVNQ